MKNLFTLFSAAVLAGGLTATSALADNMRVEEALSKRPDLSNFYSALIATGVNRELREGVSYTVFAPTNAAFAEVSPEQYPCFYAEACRPEIADILRNHIVRGEVHMTDAVKQKGGLYSIDERFIAIGEPARNNYTVDGERIVSTHGLGGSMLYKIDGVIISEPELAAFQYPRYTYLPSITTQRVYYDPSCTADYCPAGLRETTTVTTRTVTPITPLANYNYVDYNYYPRY